MKVPEGMLKAARDAYWKGGDDPSRGFPLYLLEAALKWLAENPIRPTDPQAAQLWKVAMELDPDRNEDTNAAVNLALAWQRMMFSEAPVLAAPVDAGLVERMLDAWTQAKDQDFSGTDRDCLVCMTAALRVAADALLGPVTNLEQLKMRSDFSSVSGTVGTSGWDNFDYALDRMIAARRARLLSAKTPEQRVTVERGDAGWILRKDGERVGDRLSTDIATYAKIGLIATLKGEG